MAFNGTGTFVRLYNWVTDKLASVPITASRMDAEMDGMATGLSNCITKDGQTTITANLPMNSKKFTGLTTGNARTDSIALSQVQDGQFTDAGTTGGSADAYTITLAPVITAYVATMEYSVKISATNATTTPYIQFNSIANPASTAVVKKLAADKTEIAVEAGDLVANGIYKIKRNSANTAWIVLNPEKSYSIASSTVKGLVLLHNSITIANNGSDANNDIDFSAGNFVFSDLSGEAVLSSALTKRLDASWAAGTNQGGLFTGAKANSTWYHCFAIYNPSTGAVDAGFDTSVTAANIPSGYTKYYLVESILTNGSGNIIAFTHYVNEAENRIIWSVPVLDINANASSTASLSTISTPLARRVQANIQAKYLGGSGSTIVVDGLVTSPSQTDTAPTTSLFNFRAEVNSTLNYLNFSNYSGYVLTNTSSQIRIRSDQSTATFNATITTNGWKR